MQRELELFEKKFGPKKFKERKSRNFEPETKSMNYKIIGISALVVIAAVISYFLLMEN
jgi:hypothetical protein